MPPLLGLVGALVSLLVASPAADGPPATPEPPTAPAAAPASPAALASPVAPTAAAPPAAPAAATVPLTSDAPAPLASEAVVYQDLQQRTGLDLQRVWADYQTERRAGQGFYEFARARWRRRLGAGIALSVAGLGLTAAGIALVLVAADREGHEVDVIGGALVVTAGFGLAVPGAILWPTSQVRLHKLKRARQTAGARVQLRAAGPVALPRGLGLGLGLAF